jgi:hypothetical protein
VVGLRSEVGNVAHHHAVVHPELGEDVRQLHHRHPDGVENPSWAEEPGEGDLRGATKDPPYALPNGAYPGFPGDPAYIGFVLFFFGGTHLGCLITAMGHGA